MSWAEELVDEENTDDERLRIKVVSGKYSGVPQNYIDLFDSWPESHTCGIGFSCSAGMYARFLI
jgi:hypothetical protein